jgi:glycerol uptake facilitator-like aquaporin
MLPYSLAQLAGAFVASAVVIVTYHETINAFDGGVRQVGADRSAVRRRGAWRLGLRRTRGALVPRGLRAEG